MGENHLTYFKIENFKRFDSFEMENLGQFNLLVGDNNVGKTSVLEGLLFDEDGAKFLVRLIHCLFTRKLLVDDPNLSISLNLNLWNAFPKKTTKPFEITFAYVESQDIRKIKWDLIPFADLTTEDYKLLSKKSTFPRDGFQELVFKYGLRFSSINGLNNFYPLSNITNNELIIAIKDIQNYIPFIATSDNYDSDLLNFYYKQINTDKKKRKEFEYNLKTFIPKLEEIRTQKFFDDTEMLGVVLEDENGIYPITRFGDGTIKLSRILLEILMAKGKRIMIDEIDTGIHFSRLKDFWKMVIKLCKQYDVQLFATTHSLECQRYFVEALSELGEEYQKDARNISLLENAKGEVQSVTFDFEQFEFALSIGANTRGGQR
ncbi:AAA family ATPase [Arcicella sp. DC2W]|uniref:AAA family ATPase n=1 Tax=Arcicella gelida TaxID=2984195 RepID=A0ABU5SBL6_9BACT|nr:AAA family ATPase [Arcicella sp. DC2W]MEA5405761.1 AAA family ATPase [Arcicella sp. DC2W]